MLVFDLPPPLYIPKQEIIRPAEPELILAPFLGAVGNVGGIAVEPVTLSYVAGSAADMKDTADRTVYTFPGVPFGPVASDRRLLAHIAGHNADRTISSLTIGGVSATRVTDGTTSAHIIASEGGFTNELWIAAVPTGTSGTVVVTWNGGQVRTAGALFKMLGGNGVTQAASVALDPADSGNAYSVGMTIPEDGTGLGVVGINATSLRTWSWSGLSEVYDEAIGEGNNSYSGALSNTAGTSTRTATANGAINNGSAIFAAWAPA